VANSDKTATPGNRAPRSSGQGRAFSGKRIADLLGMPLLALATAFVLGAVVIFLTSGRLETVGEAYWGLLRGAFLKERGFSESLVAAIPYIFLSLGLALGFKTGLFNIGVEGQFYMGAIAAAWAGQAIQGLPTLIHLPLVLLIGAAGGAIWAGIPGYLKAKTGAHEVISTMMMNYVAFRLTEFLISGPLRAQSGSSTIQTPRISPGAELWALWDIPNRLADPLNALAVGLGLGFLAWMIARASRRKTKDEGPKNVDGNSSFVIRHSSILIAIVVAALAFIALPPLTRLWWPFTDQYDRLHLGLVLAVLAAVGVWWLLWKTTIGFELRTVGANPNAARYAGMSITRNVVLGMALSGALAGLAGTVEVVGVSICRCLPLFFSSGYGFDSIAIALLGRNNPFGILASSFLFGAMRNGADLMELSSGVSKYIISLIQALVLLFVAAPAVVRWLYRIKGGARADEAPLTRGWGG